MAAPQYDQKYPEGGYQSAPAQFPSQAKPPSYDYGGTGYQTPVAGTSATVVVTGQPASVTGTYQSPPEEDHSGMAVCAVVFSIITLVCCGTSLVCLTCTVPALVLAIMALGARGSAQKTNAGISIGLNMVVVVCTVVFLVIFIPSYVVTASRTCPPYYDSQYRTYCVSYRYYYPCSYYYTTYIYYGHCPY